MRVRKVFSVRINPEIERDFKEMVKEKGLSTCLVLEALLIAWVQGAKYTPSAVGFTKEHIVINQKFERVVKRARRVSREYEPYPNFYTKTGFWIYKEKGEGEGNGHALGCYCADCRRIVSK